MSEQKVDFAKLEYKVAIEKEKKGDLRKRIVKISGCFGAEK